MVHINHKRSVLRRCVPAVIAAALSASLIACGTADSGPVNLSTQTWLVPQDWGAIDPLKVSATNVGAIMLVLEPLVVANTRGGVDPNLATQTMPDPTTYVYNLRKDAKFADGNPVTVDDVVYSFDIHRAPDSTSTLSSPFENVTTVETTADDQVTVKLAEPDVQFGYVVAQVGIVEKSVREQLGDGAGSPDKPNVGSGPYIVDTYNPGALLILKRNENYWGPKPQAEKLTLKLVTDDSARSLAVQSGSVTGAFDVPSAQASTYDHATGMEVISGSNPSVMLFNVNVGVAPWNDIHVRRAVSRAIDKEGIVNAVLQGRGKPAISVTDPRNLEDVLPQDKTDELYQKLDQNRYDLEAAKAELRQSAHPNGFDATVIYSEVESSAGLVAQVISQNLKPLGINLTVKSVPDAQYTDAVFFQHTAPASIVDYTSDSPDPINMPNYLSNSAQTLAKGGYTNIADYDSPQQDELLGEYLQTPANDQAKRGQLLSNILMNIANDASYIPIYNADYLAAVKDGISFAGFDGMWWMRRWVNDITVNPSAVQ
ncbi:ABC transporter substrate-binding protein [Rhodococcus wratislaviensis]|uniref:Putative ABC transporter substrate-binding protein n=1 Tax=Rhodococcus wratislaviensis NBRC 100605 TaxID=1219028 RepID=X0QYI6_RHOWR|nr:ABC transporter substrate-binding protein [Rhodococcus wratislaviensis]GAF43680.1 putative ABC transporter substrate-binding protein [Rhodococcus wratislaviensis NBRC 100605]